MGARVFVLWGRLGGAPGLLRGAPSVCVGAPCVCVGAPRLCVGAPRLFGWGYCLKKRSCVCEKGSSPRIKGPSRVKSGPRNTSNERNLMGVMHLQRINNI